MARTSRNNMRSSSFFHIMVQGINKEEIFSKKEFKVKYEKLIFKLNCGIEIIAYCIMNNHAHILIKTDEIKFIQKWMKKVNTIFAMEYNKKCNRIGYVFRDRYKVQPIMDVKHLYLCAEYIHNNPVKAKSCKNKGDYEYSSYVKLYDENNLELMNNISRILQDVSKLKEIVKDDIEKIDFLEDDSENKEEKCYNLVSEYLSSKKINLEQLKQNKDLLKEIVKELKEKEKISFRMMEKYLQISRETLRKLIR